jgi:hypothetical protein
MSPSLRRRTSGPMGTARSGHATFAIDEWELQESDPDSSDECHGWFSCVDDSFRARKGTDLALCLRTWDKGTRDVEVTIVQMNRPEYRWKFRLKR